MLWRRLIPVLLLVTAIVCAQTAPPKAAATVGQKPATKKSSKKLSKKKPPAEVKVEPPPAPPPPPTLAQQPPVAPRVTYRDGLLAIDAPNSTLGDIFGGIKRLTGATVDGPANLNDRVIVHLGPGQPREVIAALLNGSRFDYVVMGSPQQPNGISRIVLMARQGSVEPTAVAAATPTPNRPAPGRPPVANTSPDGDEEDSADSGENADTPNPQPVVAQPSQPGPVPPPMPPDQNPPAQPNQQGTPTQPKTPEQLYKELQNLERQRQQPQTPPDQPPPPPQ